MTGKTGVITLTGQTCGCKIDREHKGEVTLTGQTGGCNIDRADKGM